MNAHALAYAPAHAETWSVDSVVDEALRLAKSVNKGRADEVKLVALLPELRKVTGWGPKRIEDELGGAVERGRISRVTAASVGTARSKPPAST